MEHWQHIEGFENYSISDHGRVWSHHAHKTLVQEPNHRGYLRVRLVKDGKYHYRHVHRLVALHWLDGDRGETVNHRDLNKRNNHHENLEWASNLANIAHAHAQGRYIKKLSAHDIACLRTMRDDGYLLREIASLYGVSEPVVHRHLARTP